MGYRKAFMVQLVVVFQLLVQTVNNKLPHNNTMLLFDTEE
jgi:hypothetical protein